MTEVEIIASETDAQEMNSEDAALTERMRKSHVVQELVTCALRSIVEGVTIAPRNSARRTVIREWKLYVCEFWCCFYYGGVFLEDGRYFSCSKKLIKFVDARCPDLTPSQMSCFVKAFEAELTDKVGGFIDGMALSDTQQKFVCRECEVLDVFEKDLDNRCRRYTYTAQNENFVELIPW